MPARRLTVLRAIDKLDRLGPDGVRALLGPGRKDESGDFTKGAGLDAASQIATCSRLVSDRRRADASEIVTRQDASTLETVVARDSHDRTMAFAKASAELDEIATLLSCDARLCDDRIRIDPSVVRGLEYYTGPVFEAELLFEIQGREGPAGALRLGRRRRAL